MDRDQKGLATRRAVLGDAYVDSAFAKATPFTAPLQEIFLHASVYCGFPAAVDAFRSAAEVIDTAADAK